MQVTVISPEAAMFDGNADAVVAPAYDGQVGILPNHAPFMTLLGQGKLVVRSFAPADGINEDPVCGSGNGAVAAYRLDHGAAITGNSYAASQGREVGRDGTVRVRYGADGIHVGGCAVTCLEGQIFG